MENSNSSRGYGQWGFERKLDTSPFLCGLIMEKLVYDIIPRNQRSNPKGFRLLVKLKLLQATTTTLQLYKPSHLPHIDTCKHPRFALDSPSKRAICLLFLFLVSSPHGSLNPRWVSTMLWISRVSNSPCIAIWLHPITSTCSSSSASSANSIVIGEGTEHLAGKHSPCIVISTYDG